MFGERITGLVLLSLALVLGIVMMFVPLGDAWAESGGVRTTNEFHVFTKDVETAPASDPSTPTSTTTWYYIDDGLAETGGITYLRAMGPMALGGLFFLVVAFVVTAVPRSSPTRAGGWLALPGAVLMFFAAVLAVLGMPMHAAGEVASGARIDWSTAGGALMFLTVLFSLLATGLGLARVRLRPAAPGVETEEDWSALEPETQETYAAPASASEAEPAWDDEPVAAEPAAATAHTAETETPSTFGSEEFRYLKCPDCATIVEAELDIVPICPECSFGSEDKPATGIRMPAGRGTPA